MGDFLKNRRNTISIIIVGLLILMLPTTIGAISPPTVATAATCNTTNTYTGNEIGVTSPDTDTVRVDLRGASFNTLPTGATANNDYATNYYSKTVTAGAASTSGPSGFFKADGSGRPLALNGNQTLYARTWNGRAYSAETTVTYTTGNEITIGTGTDTVRVDLRGASFNTLPTGATANNDYATNYYSKTVAAGATSTTGPSGFFKADGLGRTLELKGNQTPPKFYYVRTWNGRAYSAEAIFSITCAPPTPLVCDFTQNGNYDDVSADIDFWKNVYLGTDTNSGHITRADCSSNNTTVDLVDFNRWRNMKYNGSIGIDNATDTNYRLFFTPDTTSTSLSQEVSFDVSFNRGEIAGPIITGVDLRISTDSKIRIVSFTPNTTLSKFNTELIKYIPADGSSLRYIAINTGDNPSLPTAPAVILGRLTVRTIEAGSSTISFDTSTQVVASGYKDAVPLDLTRVASVTVAGSNSCPVDITSTQAKLRSNDTENWSTAKTITLGDTVRVRGFHNNRTDSLLTDISLTATGPEGPSSQIVDIINNSFIPDSSGSYIITANTTDKTGSNCTGTATLTVNTPQVVTTSYRIVENPADFTDTGPYGWKPYSAESMPVDYVFKDQTPGQKSIFVEFKDSTGKTERHTVQIKVLGPDPTVNCALAFEGNNTVLNLTGTGFGSTKGSLKSSDDATDLQIRSWKNTIIQAVWPNAPAGQVLTATLTNTDGQSTDFSCSASSQLSIGAKFFCGQSSSDTTNNVDLVLAGAFEGGTKIKQKVSIDTAGVISGLTQKLEEGRNYKLSLKAPRLLRRTAEFTAGNGTTNVNNFVLPVGDIYPAPNGDGAINNFDHSELVRQWIISVDAAGRSADFNKDGRVNSIDWACMRHDFGSSDDSEPVPGGPAVAPSVHPSPSATLNTGDGGTADSTESASTVR